MYGIQLRRMQSVAILQSHKIVQIVDNEDFDNENEVEELCPEHKGKAIDAFCVLCCCICHAKHHRSCIGYGEMY